MKSLIVLLPLIFFVSCGSSGNGENTTTQLEDQFQECDPSSSFTNGWEDSEGNELLFSGDSCYGQTNDACNLRFKYYKPANGKIAFEVNSTSGAPGCLPAGRSTCEWSHGNPDEIDEHLDVNCGEGTIFYFPK